MPGATLARIRDSSPEMWRRATRLLPVAVQGVLVTAVGIVWLLTYLPIDGQAEYRIVAVAAIIITTVAALLVGAALLRAESPQRQGLGLAVGGSGLAVMSGGLTYALILLPWLGTL